jgi:hypothetical protein
MSTMPAVVPGRLSPRSRRLAGVLLLALPTVVYGGTAILTLLVGDAQYVENELRRELWRAGHAHAGVLLLLALVVLRYVDEAILSDRLKALVRHTVPAAAILLPAAFFLSVLSPDASEPNGLINLAYLGAASLAVGLLVLGVGLIRGANPSAEAPAVDGRG